MFEVSQFSRKARTTLRPVQELEVAALSLADYEALYDPLFVEALRVVHIFGSANGNRTRISALKGPRANRCTIAPQWEFREMRHSIIGERDGIDKERAEIGMRGLWSGTAVPENYARARPPATSVRRGVPRHFESRC
jgi:hypothetical protein